MTRCLQRLLMVLLTIAGAMTAACNKKREAVPDRPRLSPDVAMHDVHFHSAALNREMSYRVLLPVKIPPEAKLPAVYLLHGGGGGTFRDWSNHSDVARFAERDLILVMPEGDESYYTNSAEHPQDRYEDYVVRDLIFDVESRFPAKTGRASRAIIGVSMGGFGAIKLALKHPELFSFAGGLSPAIDVPSRPFSIKRIGQWRHHRSIFGPWNGVSQHENDPFVLTSADPDKTPFLFLTCGQQEGLLPANRNFARLLQKRHFHFEFHEGPGGHDWSQWNRWLEDCFRSFFDHLGAKN